jgi:hypothetical protein
VAASLVATWQRDQKPEVLDQILEAARPVWTGAILARNGYSADFDELPSAAKVKIWRKIAKYDSKRRISSTISIGGFIRFEPSALMSTNCGLKGGWWKGQLSAEFTLKRHERADSMSIVYGIPPARSRVFTRCDGLGNQTTIASDHKNSGNYARKSAWNTGFCVGKVRGRTFAREFRKTGVLAAQLIAYAVIPRPDRVDLVLNGFPESRLLFEERGLC